MAEEEAVLWHQPVSRSIKPYILLEELGVPFKVNIINILTGDHKKPEYLAINPLGKVPAFRDEDNTLIESGAIAYYLLDKYDKERKLSSAPRSRENAVQHQILAYSVTAEETVGKAFVEAYFKGGFDAAHGGRGNKEAYDAAVSEFRRVHQPLYEAWLGDNPYFGGDKFTVADIFAGYLLTFASLEPVKEMITSQKLRDYFSRFWARPSVQKAVAGGPTEIYPKI